MQITESLLKTGAKVNYLSPDGRTSLYSTVENRTKNVEICLIKNCADVNLKTLFGVAPFHVATSYNQYKTGKCYFKTIQILTHI